MKGVELGEEVMVNYLREGASASAAITTQERSAHMATFFSDSDFDLDFDFDFDVNLDEFANGADFSAMIPSVRSSVEHSSRLMSVEGELAGYFAVDKGVLVVSAPQQDSQLKGGDIILSVGGEEIADVQQAQRHLAAIVNVADVDVVRSGQRHTISVAAGGVRCARGQRDQNPTQGEGLGTFSRSAAFRTMRSFGHLGQTREAVLL